MSIRRARVVVVATLGMLVGTLACASGGASGSRGAACMGDRIVIVSNNWNQMVDVFAAVGQSTPVVIGSVRPGGRDELVMPPGATYAYVRSAEARRGGMPPDNRVQVRYSCRE